MSYQERINDLCKARQVFVITLGLNLAVAVGKLVWGFASGTLSMVADGFHSVLDASSNVIGILGLGIALKPPDAGHPYGHRKFEALAAISISFLMFLAAFQVLSEALHRMTSSELAMPIVSLVSYLIMLVTMAINFLVSRYERQKARELKSTLLLADAKHTLSDIYVSLTVIVALIAIQFKFPLLDIMASLVIVGVIFKAGFGIIMANLGTLVDAAILDPSYVEKLVLEVPGVTSCHKIRSRGMQDQVFLDLHVQVPKHLSIEEAHAISFQVENKLKDAAGSIIDVLVHVEDDAPGSQMTKEIPKG
ncbi:MAG: cation transporter [Candidatus Melainabacteria bacterium]|nr:cation transporter [Candidatus Melainabacteria bacterium]